MVKNKVIGFVLEKMRIVIILGLLIGVIAIFSNVFLSKANLINIIRQSAITGVISCGMTLLIISGAVDLSVGSLLSLLSVLLIGLSERFGIFPAVIVSFFLALGIGAVHGFFVGIIRGGLGESFIISFGMMGLLSGFAFIYTRGRILHAPNLKGVYSLLGKGDIGGFPIPTVIFLAVLFLFFVILNKTAFGRKIYMMGSNATAVYLSGVNILIHRILSYVLLSGTVFFASVILTARTAGAAPMAGVGYEFDVIAAVAIGGTSLAGGRGNVINTLFGVLTLSVLTNALTILHISIYSQDMIKGAIILLAVLMDQFRTTEK